MFYVFVLIFLPHIFCCSHDCQGIIGFYATPLKQTSIIVFFGDVLGRFWEGLGDIVGQVFETCLEVVLDFERLSDGFRTCS